MTPAMIEENGMDAVVRSDDNLFSEEICAYLDLPLDKEDKGK